MSMQNLFIAKRYAQAFLHVFGLQSADISKIKEAIHFLENHHEIFSLLKVPLLSSTIKLKTLNDSIIDRFALPSSLKKLIELLILHKRSYLIKDVLNQIEVLYQNQQKIETFTITSAVPLEKKDLTILEHYLARQINKSIVYETKTDSDLIGGIRMQSPEYLWEYSMRKQLAAIQACLSD